MQDLNDLYYYAKVVAHGGLASAARSLGMQKSTLSRRLALLEERLGVTLIYRSSRQFAVTEIGKEYYRQCLVVLDDVDAAQDVIDKLSMEPQGSVKMACPNGLLTGRFSDLVIRFMKQHPKVDVHLKGMDRPIDVIGEGYDIAIREGTGALEHSSLILRKLGHNPQCLVASPDLFVDVPPPSGPADLLDLASVAFGAPQPVPPAAHSHSHEWTLEGPEGTWQIIKHAPRLVTDDLTALKRAVVKALGVGQLPRAAVSSEIESGRLIPVLPAWRPADSIVSAVFPSKRGLSPSVRALLDFLADECRADSQVPEFYAQRDGPTEDRARVGASGR